MAGKYGFYLQNFTDNYFVLSKFNFPVDLIRVNFVLISYKEVLFAILRTDRFEFLANDDTSIDNGFDLRLSLGISRMQDTRIASINLRQRFTIL